MSNVGVEASVTGKRGVGPSNVRIVFFCVASVGILYVDAGALWVAAAGV